VGELRTGLFSVAPSNRKGGNRYKWKYRNNCMIARVARHWKVLPREVSILGGPQNSKD